MLKKKKRRRGGQRKEPESYRESIGKKIKRRTPTACAKKRKNTGLWVPMPSRFLTKKRTLQ